MASIKVKSDEWTALDVTTGTVQNISGITGIEVSEWS